MWEYVEKNVEELCSQMEVYLVPWWCLVCIACHCPTGLIGNEVLQRGCCVPQPLAVTQLANTGQQGDTSWPARRMSIFLLCAVSA